MGDSCHVELIQKTALDHVIQNAGRILLSISVIGCPNCATRVRNNLISLDGVCDAEGMLNMKMVEIYFDEKKVAIAALVQAVVGARNDGRHHYQAQVITSYIVLIIR